MSRETPAPVPPAGAYPPPSALDAPLVAGAADRAAHRRAAPGLLDELLASPTTQVVVVRGAGLAADGAALARFAPDDPAVAGLVAAARERTVETDGGPPRWFFLGRVAGRDVLALVAPESVPDEVVDAAAGADPFAVRGLRGLLPDLGADDVALALPAVALVAWHRTHPRCPRCGAATLVEGAGWLRRCPADASEHYPRTDPAVIMAVVDAEDRLLLGHAAHWAEGRFSTLAGFVEPGETLEDAVRREVAEEVGIAVGEVTYRGSQPWPFPASLMLGFTARATSDVVAVDGVEVTHARWFTRDELAAAVDDGSVSLPGRASIARALVEDWYGAELPGSW